MHKVRIKVCCISSIAEAQMAISRGVNAIETVPPFGVDLCSGVRTNNKLAEQKLKAFMEAVRRANI